MDERLKGYETVVFDIGNVLLKFDVPRLMDRFFPPEHKAALAGAVFGPDWQWGRFDLGREDNREIARELAARSGVPEGESIILKLLNEFHLWMEPLPLTRELEELKKTGTKMYLLTNYPQPSLARALKHFAFFRLFDGLVCSADVQQVKPGREIFRILCEKYGIDPARALFIDDNPPNTETAKEMGFSVWTYR